MIHMEQYSTFDTTHRSVVGQIRDSNAKEFIHCEFVSKGVLFMPFGDRLYRPFGHKSALLLKLCSDQRMLHGFLGSYMTNVEARAGLANQSSRVRALISPAPASFGGAS